MKTIKVYAAGKIAANDWRGIRGPAHSTDEWLECVGGSRRPTKTVPRLRREVVYVGPFFISCDHRCYHGPSAHGVSAVSAHALCSPDEEPSQQAVTLAAFAGIDQADIVYVRLDAAEAYGTMVEGCYALATGKPFVLDVDPGLPEPIQRDYWFALTAMGRRHATHPADEAAVRDVFSIGRSAAWD